MTPSIDGSPRPNSRAVTGSAAPLQQVLHVTEAPLGGVASYLQEVIASQVRHGIKVDLVTPEINLPTFADVASPNFRPITFKHARGSALALLRLGWITVRQARRSRPDVVHIHSTFAGAVIRCSRPLMPRGTKIVYCPHGWAFARHCSPRVKRVIATVERLLSRQADCIVCVSECERRDALEAGIPARRLRVIENGISPRSISLPAVQRPTRPGKLVAFVGRFDRQKGFDTYLEVMRRLKGEAHGVAIGGTIISSDELSESDFPDNVERIGWQPRDRVFELYRQADLVLMPSRWEGLPLVALEAMQAKLAVFASRVGGLSDVVIDNWTGHLFDPKDIDQVVAQIRDTTPETLRAYGERGFQHYLNRFTADRMNRRVMDLYGEVTGLEQPRHLHPVPAE